MMDDQLRARAESVIGHHFDDASLLGLALKHASTADNPLASNERLEFLGDAVLGLVVCDLVFRRYPALREGDMTKIKSHVVSRDTCAAIAKDLALEQLHLPGK